VGGQRERAESTEVSSGGWPSPSSSSSSSVAAASGTHCCSFCTIESGSTNEERSEMIELTC